MFRLNKDARIARDKGFDAYGKGKTLSDNFYQHFPNSKGAISLMAHWDVGWKMAELKDKDPEKYNELIGVSKIR
jgi:hypothetical protein